MIRESNGTQVNIGLQIADAYRSSSMVLLIASLSGGGAEKVMATLANIYSERGVNVTLITLDDPQKHPDAYEVRKAVNRMSFFGMRVDGSASPMLAQIKRIIRLRKFLKETRPNVLLSFMTTTNLLAIVASYKLNVRCVVSERTHPAFFSYGSVHNILRNLLYKRACVVVAQTESIANTLKKYTSANISIVPNFVNRRYFFLGTRVVRQKKIVAVGRLDKVKGFDLLVNAFAELANDFPDWSVVLVGEGPERNSLHALIEAQGLVDRFQLCGFVREPEKIYESISIAVQPSRFEGFPNALLEAMASGIPSVATHNAGDMLIEDGVNGLLVPVDNVEALATALRRLMNSPQLRAKLGESARRVREIYCQERVTKLWDQVLFPEWGVENVPTDA